eukprot:6189874-Pleurochrysis_carterae.AAC.1
MVSGTEAETIHRARVLIVESTVEFAEHMRDYGVGAQQKTWGHTWKINEEMTDTCTREPYPTLSSGEVVGDAEVCKESESLPTQTGEKKLDTKGQKDKTGYRGDRHADGLGKYQHKQDKRNETRRDKRIILATGETGTRIVSENPELKTRGGEWEQRGRDSKASTRRTGWERDT